MEKCSKIGNKTGKRNVGEDDLREHGKSILRIYIRRINEKKNVNHCMYCTFICAKNYSYFGVEPVDRAGVEV